jgi:putative pyruvate formate lyase activating enzyme
VFFGGCTLSCRYCQNHRISRAATGEPTSAEELAAVFRRLVAEGADCIDLVSPTPYVPTIVKALRLYKPPVPVVYNTSGYERVETLRALEGLVDVYLPDLKYVTPSLGEALSGAADYPTAAQSAIAEMIRQTGPMVLNEQGGAVKGTLIRHLVLPLHTRESVAVLDVIAERFADAWVSLLSQYTPVLDVAGFPELSRKVTRREYEKVLDAAFERGLYNGYTQDRTSATTAEIPHF